MGGLVTARLGQHALAVLVVAIASIPKPHMVRAEDAGSSQEGESRIQKWRASKAYWEMHGLGGAAPWVNGGHWNPPQWFVDAGEKCDNFGYCGDIRSHLKVQDAILCHRFRSIPSPLLLPCRTSYTLPQPYILDHLLHTNAREHRPLLAQ